MRMRNFIKTLIVIAAVSLCLNGISYSASGSVQLNWDAPTTSEDLSCLTDLSFYKVYYGSATSPTDFWTTALNDSNLSCVDSGIDAGTGCGNIPKCTFITPPLGIGTWYFNVTANDFSNNESVPSNEVSKENVDDVPASGCTNLTAQDVQ